MAKVRLLIVLARANGCDENRRMNLLESIIPKSLLLFLLLMLSDGVGKSFNFLLVGPSISRGRAVVLVRRSVILNIVAVVSFLPVICVLVLIVPVIAVSTIVFVVSVTVLIIPVTVS